MKKLLCILIGAIALLSVNLAFSQPLYNPKNVDRTAMSYFDGLQTFRALEHTVNADPKSDKIYRLQTLPENGFPAIELLGVDGAQSVYFEDKTPHDNQFTDNQTQYLSAEAVQTFYAIQRVMGIFDQRFGWKGIDGIGVAPIKIYLKNSDDEPGEPATFSEFYKDDIQEYFGFIRSLSDNKSLFNSTDVVAHEFAHAIFHRKTSIINDPQYQCNEYRTINEGIANIFGVYIKNKLKQSSPQNYDWTFGGQVFNELRPLNDPKSHEYADTYGGEYYVNACTEDYKLHPGGGVAEKWFYLLSEGFQGSAYNDLGYGYSNLTGIGVEKAIQVMWDAIPSIKVFTDYPALRGHTLQVAEKLYGLHSAEYLAVQNAWCAVGVCDNNTPDFAMYPANAAGQINPWPAVKINLRWKKSGVTKWRLQTSTKYDFSENIQEIDSDNITMVVDQNGLLAYSASIDAYYHPGEKVYGRAQIIEAEPNFCKGLNPLCQFYQQWSPIHAFMLEDQKVEFWSNNVTLNINPWNNPELNWKSVPDTHRYRIQVATDNAFNNVVYDDPSPHTGNFLEYGKIKMVLEAGKDYYARIRAERIDILKIQKNYGAWSDILNLHTNMSITSIQPNLDQQPGDPPKIVSSLGFWVNWYAYPGAAHYVIQAASDPAFANVVRSQTVAGNLTSIQFALPAAPDQTHFYLRVLPQLGSQFGVCANVLHVLTDKNATLPAMKSPANGTNFAFKTPFALFEWKAATLNMDLVHHFEVWFTEKTSGLTAIFSTAGKIFDIFFQDPFKFDDKLGFEVQVLAVGPHGAKSGLSAPFDYNICPDHPEIIFPGDLTGKVDPFQNFNIQWHDASWFDPGSQYLVTIADAVTGVPVPGFNNKPTTTTSMLVPAGTLTNNKQFSVSVRNSSSCPDILLTKNVFLATGNGGSNQPQPPKLVDFNIETKGFRNNPDGTIFPPAWGTSNFRFALRLIAPDGSDLALLDANGNPVDQLDIDSENAGVIIQAQNQPEGKYKLKLEITKIFDPFTYYPFDQPRFSVLLNGKPIVTDHVITIDLIDPNSPFNEFKEGFKYDIVLDVK